jgi:hypothetical protein
LECLVLRYVRVEVLQIRQVSQPVCQASDGKIFRRPRLEVVYSRS